MRHILAAVVSLSVLLGAAVARADFLVIPFGSQSLYLQGKVDISGRIAIFTHPALNKQLYFPYDGKTTRWVKTLTTQQQFSRMLTKAGKDPDAIMKAGVWGLKKGLIKQFHDAVKKALDIDPNHARAKNIVETKKKMDEPLKDDPQTEKDLKAIQPQSRFKVAKSAHFILLHDTSEKPPAGQKKTLSARRLELLEQVYESFLLLFVAQDVDDLDIPKERMKVLLFDKYDDYREFCDSISPALASASGFWEPERNVSVFFAHGTTPIFKELTKVQKQIKKLADDAKKNARGGGAAEIVRFANTLDLIIEMDKENSDITVVSHEGTHQMAGNTGLFPRSVMVPSWVHEGLATYFEAPADATWAGIGAVNQQRLEYYRVLEPDREHSNIDFVVGDQIFDYAGNLGAVLHGYAQAWALTHFLMEHHTKEFVEYYRILSEMPPDVRLNPELLTQLFNKVFGVDRKTIDQEWRTYMRTLKTDIENLEDEGKIDGL